MADKLIIVESPNKIEKIKSFLGKDWDVTSSVGHIRDLKIWGTRMNLGINLDTFEPIYIETKDKADVIDELRKKALKANDVYIATDPDREGEAIGYSIKKVLTTSEKDDVELNKKIEFHRISFNEITKDAVLDAIKTQSKNSLDLNLINAQEARRMLDRMIGFRLSSLTKKKVQAQSAGRVKSVVLKTIIDRENEIKNFKPIFWWTINGEVKKDIPITLVSKDFKEIEFQTKKNAEKSYKTLTGNLELLEVKKTKRTINPPKPLEMATYLMGMYSTYGMANASATRAAQSLYEKGIISYPRTDSTRISSKEFIKTSEKEIIKRYGKELLVGVPTTKKGGQDAHEAIRPTEIKNSPDVIKGLKINEKKVYTFIFNTTLKSMMIPGKNISVREFYKDGDQILSFKKSFVSEPGFRTVEGVVATEYIEPKSKTLKIDVKKLNIVDNQTKPPARYNQSSIIKKMKEEGIGRPSTYSNTTYGLIQYKYVDVQGGQLVPTELANEVNELLIDKAGFKDIINVEYTSEMERELDMIAKGDLNRHKFLKKFWNDFEPRVDLALETVEVKPPIFIGRKCPECEDGELIKKRGRFGEFIACINFPDCKHSEPLVKKPKPVVIKEADHGLCPKCGSHLVARDSRYGTKFIGCSAFPKCDYIMEKDKTQEVLIDIGLIEKQAAKKDANKENSLKD